MADTTTPTENNDSFSFGNFWDGLTTSSVYEDFLKPYAQQELGLTEKTTKQDEANVQAYNDIKQKAPITTTIGGFTPTQLAIGGAGLLALIFILKR